MQGLSDTFNIVTRAKAPQWFFYLFCFTMDADWAKENASKHPRSCTTVSHLIIRAPFMTQTSLRLPFLSLQTQQGPHAASPRQVQLLAAGGQGSCLIVHCLSVFELASVSHVHRQLKSGKLPHDITVDIPSVDLFGWYSVLHTGDPPLVCGYAGFWGFRLMM